MRRMITILPLLVLMACAGVLSLIIPVIVERTQSAQRVARVAMVRQAVDDDDVLARIDRAVKAIATSVEPSVVHIEVFDRARNELFRRASTGSGWIYDAKGSIITNEHVVRDAAEIRVQFSDGRRVPATVQGTDQYADIAVLKVDPQLPLIPARRASGERAEKGQRIFAFGSPFGYKFSMTEGIISGLGRAAHPGMDLQFSNFIQHDASVNPGNSGGPLVDIRGRVIGMNVAIATARDAEGSSEEGQSSGIAFAIPLMTIDSVVQQLIESGKVRRGFLGISFSTGSEPVMAGKEFKGVGVRVGRVETDSPASRAGVEQGDIIVAVAGQSVQDGEMMRAIISSTLPGTSLPIAVWRGEGETIERREFTVSLGEMPASVLARNQRDALFPIALQVGVNVRESGGKVIVREILEDSPAAKAGLKPGAIITKVAGESVRSTEQFYRKVVEAGLFRGSEVELAIEVDDKPQSITLKIQPER